MKAVPFKIIALSYIEYLTELVRLNKLNYDCMVGPFYYNKNSCLNNLTFSKWGVYTKKDSPMDTTNNESTQGKSNSYNLLLLQPFYKKHTKHHETAMIQMHEKQRTEITRSRYNHSNRYISFHRLSLINPSKHDRYARVSVLPLEIALLIKKIIKIKKE